MIAVPCRSVLTFVAIAIGGSLHADTLVAQARSCRVQVETVAAGTGGAIAGVEVVAGGASALTDSSGRAVIVVVGAGTYPMLVRRVGFRPLRRMVASECEFLPTVVRAELVVLTTTLEAVTVRADAVRKYSGPMAGFWERRARGDGVFFTAAQIDQRNVQRLTDLLRTVAGWGGTRQAEVLSDALVRGTAIRMGAVSREAARASTSKCFPTVVIDGMAATVGELNVDGIDPRSLSGVEVYTDASRTPSEFWGVAGQGRCGVVAIWSRSMDNLRHTPLEQQVALIDTVYDAADVEESARLDDAVELHVVYPAELRRKRTSGTATVRLVVLPTGEPFLRDVTLIHSTHPAFGSALVDAINTLRFVPGRLGGRAVSQRAELTVRFEPKDAAVRR